MPSWRPIALGCAIPILWGLSMPAQAANDLAVHLPPLYDTFQPPAVGGSYLDPVFGTSLKRLSNATQMLNNAGTGVLPFVSTEYPTASPFNSDTSRLILQHTSYYGLYDGTGAYLRDLPFAVNANTEPRWSRTDPNALYYVSGNQLVKLNVGSGVSTTVHTFGEYTSISGKGESDISRDGDHFVFAGSNGDVFVYTISTDTKGPVLANTGHPFNNLYIASDNSVAIGWLTTGTARFTGVELFSSGMVFLRQLTHAIGHQHLTRDGSEDVLIWNNSNDPPPAPCQNGIVKVRLSNAQQTCLLLLDFSLATHITAPDGNGWVYVETYAPGNPPAALPGWKLYTNEILRVRVDGTGGVERLFHHRSRQTSNYQYQPRAAVSRDGNALVFTSNYDLQAILGYPSGYTDVYLMGTGVTGPLADLSITKTDGQATAMPGQVLTYTIVASNQGPNATSATVTDNLPASLTGASWTCAGTGGGTCTAPSGNGSINDLLTLPSGASVTYSLTGTVGANPISLRNTATITAPADTDRNLTNNSATDDDTLICAGGPTMIVVPDGRLTSSTLGGSGTARFLASLRLGNSYSLEFKNAMGMTPPGTLTVFAGDDGCGATSTLSPRDTTAIDPQVGTSARRVSFTASGIAPQIRATLVNGSGPIPFSYRLADTTMFSPAWTTNGTFETYYSFQNTTSGGLTGTLTLLDTAGATVGTFMLSMPAAQAVSTNTSALSVPRGRTGTAKFTHDGPPGAVLAAAALANFSISPAYVQPVKFQAVRESR